MDSNKTKRRSILPRGVELRQGEKSASIRVTFTFLGERRRETLAIEPSPANIRYAGKLVASVELAIQQGTFDYAKAFPNSVYAKLAAVRTRKVRHKIGQLVNDYLDINRKLEALSPSTISTYSRWNEARIQPHWANVFLDQLTAPDLREWIAELATELKKTSIKSCVCVLRNVIDQAHTDKLIHENPFDLIKMKRLLPKRKKQGDDDKIDPFNESEIKAILRACLTAEDRALYCFAFSTGLRTGELIALKWKHLDWIGGNIHVEDNIVRTEKGTVEKTTKTDMERDIPMLASARASLEEMKPISMLRGEYIFLNPNTQKRWSNDSVIREHWIKILRRAKVRYRNPYQTRHTFASTLLMNGEPELLVARLLGHNSVEMIRKHYGRYIKQPAGIMLRGDYDVFASAPQLPQDTKKVA